jgi:hypothetical protein
MLPVKVTKVNNEMSLTSTPALCLGVDRFTSIQYCWKRLVLFLNYRYILYSEQTYAKYEAM